MIGMAEVGVDVVQQILVRLDVEDLLRCKAVCKSWHSLLSTPCFITSHLKHALKSDRLNPQLGHRSFRSDLDTCEDEWFALNVIHIVGTYNGLVCFSPKDVELLICNPCTRQEKKLPKPPHTPFWRAGVCWGFGYADDDYKVVVGFKKNNKRRTLFYELTLKSNTWNFIGKVKYSSVDGKSATFYAGALHWLMSDKNKKVIVSLDLSTLKFKEIPQPEEEDDGYQYSNFGMYVKLGVIEDYLCICTHPFDDPSKIKKWVMKNNKWELYTHPDHCPIKYDVAHSWIKMSSGRRIYVDDGGTRVGSYGGFAPTSIFVKSLVSPHLHEKGQEDIQSHTKGNIRKRKKKSCRHNINKPFRLWN